MTTNQHPALTEAYHAIFDAKDKLPAGGTAFVLAADALRDLASLMESLGWDVPHRFDGEGRPKPTTEDFTVVAPYLALNEADAAEVFGALGIASQAAAPFDKVISAHYLDLYTKLVNQTNDSGR